MVKKLFALSFVTLALLVSCGGNGKKNESKDAAAQTEKASPVDQKAIDKAAETEVEVPEAEQPAKEEGIINLAGKIAGVPVHMSLVEKEDEIVYGRYYYDKQRASGNTASLKLVGYFDDSNNLLIYEFDENNLPTGVMTGLVTLKGIKGQFLRTKDLKEFEFDLARTDEDNYFTLADLTFDNPFDFDVEEEIPDAGDFADYDEYVRSVLSASSNATAEDLLRQYGM